MLDQGSLLQLQLTPLFAGLPEADIRALVEGAEVVTLDHEHPLHTQGDPVERFFVVLDGHVEVSVEEGGRRSVVEVAHKGAVMGDAALFGDGRFLTSGRVLTGATILSIPARSFLAKLEPRFDIISQMLSGLSFRLRLLVRQIAELKLKTTAQRLGSFLLSMAGAEEGRAVVRFPYDKKLVADELGMKPESLSRALAKLAPVGVDSRPDNSVVIADVERLRDFCAEDDLG
jgi:cAMP-binding proteins - catabolite gene activator and regulatory subunit of cAMP-dependent protein kinases